MGIPIKLKKGRENSIKEAVISLFLSSPIIQPARFGEILNDQNIPGFFQSFERVDQVSFSVESVEGKLTNKENNINNIGFKLLKFDKGQPEFVLQGINEGKRNFFSFHDLNYSRWANFIENYSNLLKAIQRIQGEIFLAGISLQYVDEFIWVEEGKIDLSKIMEAKDYLPQNFIKIKSGHLINTREIESQNDIRCFDRIEVLLSSDIAKTVTISHNQNIHFKNLINLKEEDTRNSIINELQVLHNQNKAFLKDVLLGEVKTLIRLI